MRKKLLVTIAVILCSQFAKADSGVDTLVNTQLGPIGECLNEALVEEVNSGDIINTNLNDDLGIATGLNRDFLIMDEARMSGPITSGGGTGVVCRNDDGSIKSVELLDLWEARVIYGRTIADSNLSAEDLAEEQLQNFKNSIYAKEYCIGGVSSANGGCSGKSGPEGLYSVMSYIVHKMVSDKQVHGVMKIRGANLSRTDDVFEFVTPSDCEIEQIVRYHDVRPAGIFSAGIMYINQDLVDMMDNVNKSALYLHEAFYAQLRAAGGERSSIRTRRAIGLAFSGYQFKPLESFLPDEYYECKSVSGPLSRVFVYSKQGPDVSCSGGVRLQIESVLGMKNFEFEEETVCSGETIKSLFSTGLFEVGISLSRNVGYDYFVEAAVGVSHFFPEDRRLDGTLEQESIQLHRSPESSAESYQALRCTLITTPTSN